MKIIYSLILSLSVLSGDLFAKDLTVLVDLSQSNPLLIDPNFNKQAALYTWQKITELKRGDRVLVKSFGSLQATENFRTRTMLIKRHNARRIAKQVGQFIQDTSQNKNAQGSTNLLAWFNRNPVDCKNGDTIIILTDGIEASEYINPAHLLSGKKKLPNPTEYVQIKNCNVIFYGLGIGLLDREVNILRKAWTLYFDAAKAIFKPVLL